MKVKQLSIFIKNEQGRLAEVIDAVASSGVNIRALSLADTSEFGVLRMIVDSPDKAAESLKEKGLTVKETEVIAVEVADRPGGLNGVMQVFKAQAISIEYMYAFVEKNNNNAVMVFRVEDAESAAKKLTENGVVLLSAGQVYKL